MKSSLQRLQRGAAFLLSLSACLCTASGQGSGTWPLLEVKPFVTRGGYPVTEILAAPGAAGAAGKVYFAEQHGKISALVNGQPASTPFLQLDTEPSGEQGLLGMAFAPGYPANARIYLFHTGTTPGFYSRVSRFAVDTANDRVIQESEEIILQFSRQRPTHVGGQIRFGPDGFLYIATGDDGSPGAISTNAQDLTRLSGKLLRIDPEGAPAGQPYLIPPGNPFAGQAGKAPEILACGLRNPWRFTYHPVLGDLYIADVGEDSREEINLLPPSRFGEGVNFGWPYQEGTLANAAFPNPGKILTPPYYEYDTPSTSSGGIVGGEFYTPPGAPGEPLYLFADLSGQVSALGKDSNGQPVVKPVGKSLDPCCMARDGTGNILIGTMWSHLQKIIPATMIENPVFQSGSDNYRGPLSVGISSPQQLAGIRYTLDGTDPTESSALLPASGSFTLEQSVTVKARAFHPGLPPSGVVSAGYQLVAGYITAPAAYLQNFGQVELRSSHPADTIRYTTDGSDVTPASPAYNPANPPPDLFLTRPTVVKACAYYEGWLPGGQLTVSYQFVAAGPQNLKPTYNGYYPLYSPVTLVSATTGATIRYTTDGSTPNGNSPVYTPPLYLQPGMVLQGIAYREGMSPSGVSFLGRSGILACRGTAYQVTPDGTEPAAASAPTAEMPLRSPEHVARGTDGTLLVAGRSSGPSVWKIQNGTTTRVYAGVYQQDFMEARALPGGGVLIRRIDTRNQPYWQEIWNYSAPGYDQRSVMPLGTNGVAGAMFPESDGSVLVVRNGVIYRCREGMNPVNLGNPGVGIQSLCRSSRGEIFVATSDRRIMRLENNVAVPAYGSGVSGNSDGPGTQATFSSASHVAADSIGNLYVVDSGVRKISPDGMVSTLMGPFTGMNGQVTSAESRPSATGSIAIDAEGVVYGANGNHVWRFVQEDWDNDGFADAWEVAQGAPWLVGRDDRLHVPTPGGQSVAAAWVFGNGSNGGTYPASGLRRISADEVMIAARAEAGTRATLELSSDLIKWYPQGPTRTVQGNDIASKVSLPAATPRVMYRYRFEK